jgi:hypothetical protein
MATARASDDANELEGGPTVQPPAEVEADPPPAWEMIANGRYMPRRIRGSCLGRELG